MSRGPGTSSMAQGSSCLLTLLRLLGNLGVGVVLCSPAEGLLSTPPKQGSKPHKQNWEASKPAQAGLCTLPCT